MLQPWWDDISLVQCSPCGKAAKASKGFPALVVIKSPDLNCKIFKFTVAPLFAINAFQVYS